MGTHSGGRPDPVTCGDVICARARATARTRLALAALAVFTLAAAGCGGDSDEDTTSPEPAVVDGSAETIAADDGGESAGGGGGDSPELDDIAIPLPPGASSVDVSEAAPFTIVLFNVPLDQQDATIEFYDDWTAAQADEYVRTNAGASGVSWQNDPDTGGEKHIIAVVAPLEGDDFFPVTLTIGPAE